MYEEKGVVKMYKIIPFIWYDLSENKTFFQTKESSVVITDEKLICMLKELEVSELTELDEKIIMGFFEKEITKDIIIFLEENKIIKEFQDKKSDFKNIILHSNDSEFSDLFKFTFSDEYLIYMVDSLNSLKNIKLTNELLVVFFNPFKFKEYEDIVKFAQESNITIKIIFSYNHHIYITNFYKKEWFNPCPICFFSELESQLRGEITNNTTNFQTMIDLLYSKSEKFHVEYPLVKKDYFTSMYVLMRNMNSNLEYCDLNEVLSINLRDNCINKDISYHWGYCDCYE